MKTFHKIGVLTSGGDAPGMNAAIRAVARTAISCGVEVMGIYRGYSGLIDGDIHPLAVRDVSNIINHGGTMLYSDRCPEFKTEEGVMKAVKTCEAFGIDGIVAIGGDGTFRGATDLTLHGVPCIGLPGTIDNDITSTDATIGYDTAMNTTMDIIDRLRDTCESHARCSVIEVMGRNAGDIALNAAIASGATAVAIPEMPFDEEKLFEKIRRSKALGKRNFLVLVSEGMGTDYAPALCARIEEVTGVESRFARPAHIIRGGNPTLADRVMATRMGEYAVDCLLRGESNLVICTRHGEIVARGISHALILDRMYKNKLRDGDLDAFTPNQIKTMREHVDEKRALIASLYETVNRIGL